ncbi:MAG: phosphoglycerate kinase, partial [Candidatus Falkowbacteria bacterium]
MKIKSIKSIKKLKNKTVLVRCDFDVPIIHKNTKTRKHENTIKIVDDTRLQACIPTIKYLLRKKVKQIILIGHLGRPKGIDNKLSLEPVAKRIQELLGQK